MVRQIELPQRSQEGKHDALLIKGAVGALRDKVPFALETTIEQRGIIFTDKVAVVRNRRTGEVVAEVKVNEKGIIFPEHVAETRRTDTGDNSRATRVRDKGWVFPKKVADTDRD